MTARSTDEISTAAEAATEYAIEATDIRQRLGDTEILAEVSLRARRGEVYGLLGPNGAGKTTTLYTALGVLDAVSGQVRLFGRAPSENPSVRRDVGVVFEHETLNPRWSVTDNLRRTCAVYEVPRSRIDETLRTVGLDPAARERNFGDLSNGMQRKASLANALVPDPDLLVLDEPTSGLDPDAQRTVRSLVADFRDTDRTVLFSSHDLDTVAALSDRIGIIQDGETVLETPTADTELASLYFEVIDG